MKTEREETAIPTASGYSMDLYCCMKGCYSEQAIGGFDGPGCYYAARKQAKRLGWQLHNDGFATCPNHKKKPI